MGDAEDAVRKRLLQREQVAQDGNAAERRQLTGNGTYLTSAIPRLLAELARKGWPEAQLIRITGPRRRFREATTSELAGIELWSERPSDHEDSAVWLLSDGRLCWAQPASGRSGFGLSAISHQDVQGHYGEGGAWLFITRASQGVRTRLGD
jgi:hypothetical protein